MILPGQAAQPYAPMATFTARFDAVFQADPSWRPPLRPTVQSLGEISRALGIVALPSRLTQLAEEAKYFGTWFGSLGPDFASPTHILALNTYFRRRGLAKEYILLTFGFDDVCDCLDTSSSPNPDQMKIIQISTVEDRFSSCSELAPSFENYLEKLVAIFGTKEAG